MRTDSHFFTPIGLLVADLNGPVSSRMANAERKWLIAMVRFSAPQIPCGINRLAIACAKREEIASGIGALGFRNGLTRIPYNGAADPAHEGE